MLVPEPDDCRSAQPWQEPREKLFVRMSTAVGQPLDVAHRKSMIGQVEGHQLFPRIHPYHLPNPWYLTLPHIVPARLQSARHHPSLRTHGRQHRSNLPGWRHYGAQDRRMPCPNSQPRYHPRMFSLQCPYRSNLYQQNQYRHPTLRASTFPIWRLQIHTIPRKLPTANMKTPKASQTPAREVALPSTSPFNRMSAVFSMR